MGLYKTRPTKLGILLNLSSGPSSSRTDFSEESASEAGYGVVDLEEHFICHIKLSRSPLKGRIRNQALV